MQRFSLNNFFQTQLKTKKKKDWVSQVLVDIHELKLKVDFEDIKKMKKSELKKRLNNAVDEKTLNDLQNVKKSHSKVKHLKHTKLEMQRYFKAGKLKISQEEVRTIFKMRSRVSDVKTNFRNKYDSLLCDLCYEEDESQEHLLNCKEIISLKKKMKNHQNMKNFLNII